MKSVLVLYATTDGQTAKIAHVLATTLRQTGCLVDLCDVRDTPRVTAVAYDAVIVAAAVQAGGYKKQVRSWVSQHHVPLSTKPTAFVSVCLAVLEHRREAQDALQRILQSFFRATGWAPTEVQIVAGALPFTKYGWLKKRIMRRIARRAGGGTDITRDYEYTDWDGVRRFAREFAERQALVEAPLESVHQSA